MRGAERVLGVQDLGRPVWAASALGPLRSPRAARQGSRRRLLLLLLTADAEGRAAKG